MTVSLKSLVRSANDYLLIQSIADYCPNGLQVEGRDQVRRIVTGVTASQALIDAAIACEADAILVHHGYFWKNEDARIIGMKQRRLKALLCNDISLLAYHLPLDIHPQIGNNVQLAQHLGWIIDGGLEADNPNSIALVGHLPQALSPQALASQVASVLQREPLLIAGEHSIRTIAWCSGGAQGYIGTAIARGVDAYLTGEASEQTFHSARENGITFLAAGHHATERFGIQALGDYLAERLGVEHRFIDIPNPI